VLIVNRAGPRRQCRSAATAPIVRSSAEWSQTDIGLRSYNQNRVCLGSDLDLVGDLRETCMDQIPQEASSDG